MIFYLKSSLHKKKIHREIQAELESLIISFNQYAHRNISLIEDRIQEAKTLLKEMETYLSRQFKTTFFSPLKTPSSLKKGETSPSKSASLQSSKRPQTPSKSLPPKPPLSSSHLETYFKEKEKERLEKMTLDEKLVFYKHKNFSERDIAKQLNVSIDEVKLRWTLQKEKDNL